MKNTSMVLTDIKAGVLSITLNRPESLNSFNEGLHQQLSKAMDIAEQDESVRCVLLTGAGRGFCSGQDLTDRNAIISDGNIPDLGQSVERYYNPLIRRMTSLPKPIICAVNGVAAGAGVSLALACDIVIAARTASFIQAFCRIGLVPDSGGSWFLPHKIGHARAMGMALLGDKISAEQALAWGMIWQVVEPEELEEKTHGLAQRLAMQPTVALGGIKQATYAAAANTLEQQLDLERDLQRICGHSDDFREGISAFIEKRQPVFKGK
ncbi:2-(1,2-epoxy-1,2-dihydrophenyl)acetyl-CoA isomerase PaaG [Xenorhabdus szentirmaii]|uniref:Enoyl-CoA hydratase paaG n=1 Tax=Xenorhabdus szentirmaii DSM 16338 TaxID=1427518 RepID=W1J2T7_9GAMM|nr:MULTISPECIES: 2-(1,2-epoxy-1,2-dihydrophenyl)acetyl-CoA isomerase PaaG [Xenorhabdus]MBD2790770.1 2-(1,2-epoxy-1,2-dihydrophenyl)acetyl-CoA isomerase [Xenorhabdus sp. CUL]MBD2820640.1 2-(1,2-epoxy-1,2-dihydrophenyl)acetyl-CoA isomerase [Xenorhabdus sp. 42]MBD2824116.1 2-(1,2-epoxy-1,2-dihydrophenyl)acetyl-CoA isomerase [Xenorhabdus sp. 5]PHM34608.1 2-acetyl-CoA isomerase [Xenorhabdus szentirmaii DSM 16338]CDL85029.1 putative enoyl-CoA hydratase paaG [Xenorhabdus szentirmaii DSM 16338]